MEQYIIGIKNRRVVDIPTRPFVHVADGTGVGKPTLVDKPPSGVIPRPSSPRLVAPCQSGLAADL